MLSNTILLSIMATTTQIQTSTLQYTSSRATVASNITKVQGIFQKNLKRRGGEGEGEGRGGIGRPSVV